MTGSVGRVRDVARISTPAAALLVIGLAAIAVVSVSIATRFGLLQHALLLAGVLALLPISIRWPLLPLFIFVALVPVEDALNLTGVGTVGRLAGIYFAVVYALPRLGHLTLRAMPTAAWAYLAWAVVSIFWAIDPSVTQNQLLTLGQLFVIGLLVANVVIDQPGIVRPLLWVYTASASVTASLGLVAYVYGPTAGGARVAALPGQDPAQFAAILLPALVFSLYEFLHGRRVLGSATALTLCSVAIIVSGTRGAWVGAAVVFALFVLPRLRPRQRVAAIAIAVALVVLIFQIPGLADLFYERAALATTTGGSGRTDIWAVGLKIFEASPLTGVGHANFPVAYNPTFIAGAEAYALLGYARAPHSIVIGTLGELGLVGFACLALFLGPLLLRRGWGEDAAVVQSMLVSVMLSALFLDVLANRKQVWLIIGLAAGLAYLKYRGTAPTAAADDHLSPIQKLPT